MGVSWWGWQHLARPHHFAEVADGAAVTIEAQLVFSVSPTWIGNPITSYSPEGRVEIIGVP